MTHQGVFTAKPSIVSCELDGGSVLLDLETSQYFGLNAVGLFVWEALSRPSTAEQLCQAVQDRFEVTPERCTVDIDRLLTEMIERRLVDREAASVG